MDKLIISDKKFEEFKARFYYFNHHQELRTFEDVNWDLIPQEYRYFMVENRPFDVLQFCNAYYGFFLANIQEVKTDEVILDTLDKINIDKRLEIKNIITADKSLWERLLERSKATYSLDLDRSKGDRVTQSLLHIYASAYENTEMLKVLYWVCQSLINEPLKTDFENYKDQYGNIKKGLLIGEIIKLLNNREQFREFKNIIEKAYFGPLRHLSSHNSASLDDEKKLIVSIDNSRMKVRYAKAFKHFYALQQLQNYLRMFINLSLMKDEDIQNEGIFLSITYDLDDVRQLSLIQLFPFYNFDSSNDKQLKEISIKHTDDFYIFKTVKDLIKVKRDPLIDDWFESLSEKKVTVYSVCPNIFVEEEDLIILNTELYGDFLVIDEYTIDDIQLV